DYVRQYGTSDVGAAKKVRRAAAGFYERAGEYRAALDDPARLEQVLGAHVLGNQTNSRGAAALARYMENAAGLLAKQSPAALVAGQIEFPAPPATAANP